MNTPLSIIRRGEPARALAVLRPVALSFILTLPATAAQADDFTFRRVPPPEKGAERLIMVQIAIGATAVAEPVQADEAIGLELATLGELEPLGPVQPPTAIGEVQVAQFWSAVPAEPGPGRLARAAALAGSFGDRAGLRRLGLRYGALVEEVTRKTAMSPALVPAVIAVESAGRIDAVSRAGAAGLMQLMPQTAERFGVQDRFDPAENLRGGVTYLSWLLEEFDGDALLALAGYNAGENAVRRHGGVPPYPETLAYVPKVLAAWQAAAELCTTPQVSAGDACELKRYALAQP